MESGIFLYAVLTGISALCAYGILMVLRKLIRHSPVVTGIEDMVFWIGVSIYLFRKMYETTYGNIRWFFILGLLCGAGAAFLLLRPVLNGYFFGKDRESA